MKNFNVNCIDIWTEGNDNPLRFESFKCNDNTLWHIHEEYFNRNVHTYDIDFVGTYAECVKVMCEYVNMKVVK